MSPLFYGVQASHNTTFISCGDFSTSTDVQWLNAIVCVFLKSPLMNRNASFERCQMLRELCASTTAVLLNSRLGLTEVMYNYRSVCLFVPILYLQVS